MRKIDTRKLEELAIEFNAHLKALPMGNDPTFDAKMAHLEELDREMSRTLDCPKRRSPGYAVSLGLPPTTLIDTRLLPGAKLDGLHVCSEASQWRAKIWL